MTKDTKIDMEIIRDLAKILNETNLSNIELEQDGIRICVSRQGVLPPHEKTIYTAIPPHATTPPAAATTPSPAKEEKLSKNAITSPMVGTAYLAPSPGAQPFVEIGQNVSEGQTLLIIEAMKTMNHISSPRSGTVKAIFVKDSQPVEFEEPLIVVE